MSTVINKKNLSWKEKVALGIIPQAPKAIAVKMVPKTPVESEIDEAYIPVESIYNQKAIKYFTGKYSQYSFSHSGERFNNQSYF
jgi:hypothetical protein